MRCRGRGDLPRPRRGLPPHARAERPPARGHARHRDLPHGGAGRAPGRVPGVRRAARRVQLVPRPPLPEVPDARAGEVGRAAPGAHPPRAALPRGLHGAGCAAPRRVGASGALVCPAWARPGGESPLRELAAASASEPQGEEPARAGASARTTPKEAGSETASRRTGTGYQATPSRASGQATAKLSWPRRGGVDPAAVRGRP